MTKSEEWANSIRLEIIEAAHDVGKLGVHIGSSLSAVDVLAVLYAEVLNYDITNPLDYNKDIYNIYHSSNYYNYYYNYYNYYNNFSCYNMNNNF